MSMSSEGGDRLADDIKSIRPYACTWGETKRYVCAYPDCGEYFTKWSLLQKHTKISHKTSKCEICGKAILKKNLSAHVKIHDASRPEVPCTVEGCQKVFSTERTLATHIKTAHPSSPADTQRFECTFDNCGQSFSFKHVLKRHIRNIHTLPKAGPTKQRNDMLEFDVIDELAGLNEEDEMIKLPFVCEILGCNRRYSTKALLKRHLKSSIHKSDGMKGLAALEAMEQEENQAIQEIIALHLDPTLNK
ncbi:hypothetical protein FBU30_002151 [Linnemannia zychae]|nr:hypothetical protein FBU30_002151 [Linnemannia zychae]